LRIKEIKARGYTGSKDELRFSYFILPNRGVDFREYKVLS
jgi:hypothetical protein